MFDFFTYGIGTCFIIFFFFLFCLDLNKYVKAAIPNKVAAVVVITDVLLSLKY
jgi:hypothetical protein